MRVFQRFILTSINTVDNSWIRANHLTCHANIVHLLKSPNFFPGYIFLMRKLLVTTLTELMAMAKAANIGLRNPSAASGMPKLL